MKKTYSNGEVTIVWKPDKCIHSGICAGGLPEVFRPKERPWVKVNQASTEELISQVKKCPSGALDYYMNSESKDKMEKESTKDYLRVEVMQDGPLMLYGPIELKNPKGEVEYKSKATALCRCGASENKPFCDGSHKSTGFTG